MLRYLFCILFICTTAMGASIWYASPNGDADAACTFDAPGTIQAAIDKAVNGTSWDNGDTVILLTGTYDFSDAVYSGKNCIEIPKNKNYLTLKSQSGNFEDVIIKGRGSEVIVSDDLLTTNEPFYSRALYSSSISRLCGLTITNFYNNVHGTAISGTSGYLTIYDCFIAGNVGVPGSAIGTCANLYGSTFSGNSTTANGGVITTGYSTIISNCLFIGNSAYMAGCIDGLCGTLIDCVFSNNVATKYSGCLDAKSANTIERCLFVNNQSMNSIGVGRFNNSTITNCTFLGNSASGWGVAQYGKFYDCRFLKNQGSVHIGTGISVVKDSLFEGNSGYSGGVQATLVSGCIFTNNMASGNGGASGSGGRNSVYTNCLFVNNYAKGNGGALAGTYYTVYDSTFIGNEAVSQGGCMYGEAMAIRCKFIANKANTGGVGLHADFKDCLFYENSAKGASGVASLNTYTTEGCVFIRNSAGSSDGCITPRSSSSKVINSIFIENEAPKSAIGNTPLFNCLVISNKSTVVDSNRIGLLQNSPANNCTFIGNSVAGNGVISSPATNCLFYENIPYDISSKNVKYGNCLYGSVASDTVDLSTSIKSSNPRFNFGKNPKLPYYSIRRGSPARDAGAWHAWATNVLDIAGNPRMNGNIDIGCYEFLPHGLQTIFEIR